MTHATRLLILLLGLSLAGLAQAGPRIKLSPRPVMLHVGDSLQLQAEVTGPSEYRLKWILQGPPLAGVDAGQLDEQGRYTAPAELPPGPVRVVLQVYTKQWNLHVGAASVPVRIIAEGQPLPDTPKDGPLLPFPNPIDMLRGTP